MAGHRGLLVLLVLGALQAHAQEGTARPGRRRLVVPQAAGPALYVPEVRVMPGMSTTLRLPRPVRPGAVKLEAPGEAIRATLPFPTAVVLTPSTELGPEQISLTVITEEGRSYPFVLIPQPEGWDSEVTVAFEKPVAEQMTVGSVVESLLKRQVLRVRDYGRPEQATASPDEAALPQDVWVERAVRRGDLFYIVVRKFSDEPWAVQEARLEGPKGEELRVVDLFGGGPNEERNTNVIVAEVPRGVDGDYTLTSIQLISQAGQVVTLEGEVVLP